MSIIQISSSSLITVDWKSGSNLVDPKTQSTFTYSVGCRNASHFVNICTFVWILLLPIVCGNDNLTIGRSSDSYKMLLVYIVSSVSFPCSLEKDKEDNDEVHMCPGPLSSVHNPHFSNRNKVRHTIRIPTITPVVERKKHKSLNCKMYILWQKLAIAFGLKKY